MEYSWDDIWYMPSGVIKCGWKFHEIPAILGFAMTFPAINTILHFERGPSCPSLPCLITRPLSSVGGLVIPVATHGDIYRISQPVRVSLGESEMLTIFHDEILRNT